MADNDIPDPQDINHGELNPSYINSRRAALSPSELQRKKNLEYTNPDGASASPSPRVAIALENSFFIYPPFGPEISVPKYQNVDKLIAVRAQIIEQDRVPHPEQGLQFDDGTEIPEGELLQMFDVFIAASSDITEPVSKGDYIFVDYANRLTRTGPKYYGLFFKASQKSGKNKDKRGSKPEKPTASLQDTSAAPNNSSPVPTPTMSTQMPAVSNNNPFDCSSLAAAQSNPGIYPVAPAPYDELVEMAVIPGTAALLFPKKYMKALQAMKDAYKAETGQELGITSAFRSVDLQRCMYQRYLARGKPWPPVGNPDKVKKGGRAHITGRAIDFGTLPDYNRSFRNFSESSQYSDLNDTEQSRTSFEKTRNGDFGPVARWLTTNSQRFGFIWTGWNFQELWHYDFVEEEARKRGLID